MNIKHLLGLIVFAVLAVACNPENPRPSSPSPEPPEEQSADLISVQVLPDNQEHRVLITEDIPLDNCDGNEPLSSTVERTHSVFHVAELGTSAEINVGGSLGVPGVGEVEVGSAIATHYSTSYGEEESVSHSVSVSAEEGSHVIHTVEQFETWETGKVAIFLTGEERAQEPYSFRRGFGVQVTDIKNVGDCETTPTPSGAPPIPTSTPFPTYTPYPTYTAKPNSASASEPTTPTSVPTPTTSANTPPDTILEAGDEWKQDAVGLRLNGFVLNPSSNYDNELGLDFTFSNYTGQDIVVNFTENDFLASTNTGKSLPIRGFYNRSFWCDDVSRLITAGEKYRLCGDSYLLYVHVDLRDTSIDEIVVRVTQLSRVSDARWRIPIPR